jgi:hypothetical protein
MGLQPNQREALVIFGQDKNGKSFSCFFNPTRRELERLSTPSGAFFINYCGVTQKSDSTLVVCGGIRFNLMGISDQCFEYNLITNRVKKLPPMRNFRYTFPIVMLKNRIYAIGGRVYGDDQQSILRSCEIFDFAKNAWSPIADLNKPRCTATAMIFGDQVWVFGGYTGQFERSRKIERYNEGFNRWEVVDFKLVHGFENGNVIAGINPNEILIMGGKFNYGESVSVFQYDFARKTVIGLKPLSYDHVLSKHFTDRTNTTYMLTQPDADRLVFEAYNETTGLHEAGPVTGPPLKDFIKFKQYNFNSPNIEIVRQEVPAEPLIDYKDLNVVFGNDTEPFQLNIHRVTGDIRLLPINLSIRVRSNQGCIRVSESDVMLFGGSNKSGQRVTSKSFLANLSTGGISHVTKMSRARHSFASVKLGDFIYACGGKEGMDGRQNTLSFCERYDLKTHLWTSIAPLLIPRSLAQAFAFGGRLFVAGGVLANDGRTDTVEVYDQFHNVWYAFGLTLPGKMSGSLIIPGVDTLFIGGGNMGHSDSFHKYKVDLSARDRSLVVKMTDSFKDKSYGNKIALVQDKIIVFGGSKSVFLMESRSFKNFVDKKSAIAQEGSTPITSPETQEITNSWEKFEGNLITAISKAAFSTRLLRDNAYITTDF